MAISGKIDKAGDAVTITYSGGIQQWTVPLTGLYRLQAYGAKGGDMPYSSAYYRGGSGGQGGFAEGYLILGKDDIIYVVVGGAGAYYNRNARQAGGYNGGGAGSTATDYPYCTGGGATHIARVTGLLSTLSAKISDILIVAGGGGGAGSSMHEDGDDRYPQSNGNAGAGGGTTGQTSPGYSYNGKKATGGSQNKGGVNTVDNNASSVMAGRFGQGNVNWYGVFAGAGGGGFYGGAAASQGGGGGGGSSYIGGVPAIAYGEKTYTSRTTQGGNSGNGRAVITFIAPDKGDHTAYIGDVPVMFYLGEDVEFNPFL